MSDLLPGNATPWMRETAAAGAAALTSTEPYLEQLGQKFHNPSPSLVPYLICEAGLGILSPYVPNLYELYFDGIRWQRLRGDIRAVHMGLGFIGYEGRMEWAPSRRRRWHNDQLELARLPDLPSDLPRIDGVVRLSSAERSHFYRGFRGYDVRATEASYAQLSGTILGDDSGTRVTGARAKWSFGEDFGFVRELGADDLEPLGLWIKPGGTVAFSDLHLPFADIHQPFNQIGGATAKRAMASGLAARLTYAGFYNGETLLGARRLSAGHQVGAGDTYQVAGEGAAPDKTGSQVYAACRTGFDDFDGADVTHVALLADTKPAAGLPPYQQHLTPPQIKGGVPIARTELATTLEPTKRTHVRWLLSFADS